MRFYEKYGTRWILFNGKAGRTAIVSQAWPDQSRNVIFAVWLIQWLEPARKHYNQGYFGRTMGKAETYSINEAKAIGQDWVNGDVLPTDHDNWISPSDERRGIHKLQPDWRQARG